MKKRLLSLTLIISSVTGCATGPAPQTGSEFRQSVTKGGYGTEIDTFEVNRKYASVAATLKQQSKECLNLHLVKTQCVGISCTEWDSFYLPTFNESNNKVDLVVQWRREPQRSLFSGGKPPKDGYYITAVDAVPASGNKTKITIYGPSNEALQSVPTAIKHWAIGDNTGCPDLAQTHWY